MNGNYRPTAAFVDTAQLKDNFNKVKDLFLEPSFICPMVKANAYGHGDVAVAKALRETGAKNLGVALVEEGMHLRTHGDHDSIFVFGPFDTTAAQAAIHNRLTLVANEFSQLQCLENAVESPAQVPVHIEFNTGMNRLGFAPTDAEKIREWFERNRQFSLQGICTHLLRGDDAGEPSGESAKQFAVFRRCLDVFQGWQFEVHALNSSGCVGFQMSASKVGAYGARPGISIYGIHPSNEKNHELALKPVLSLKTKLCNIHRLQSGDPVSYGPRWRATRASVIGVVPVGYADGYSRALSNCGSVLFRGQRAQIVGSICMDYFMIDLTDILRSTSDSPRVGDEVVLIGEQEGNSITASELAIAANTIAYEILCGISSRVPRIYL